MRNKTKIKALGLLPSAGASAGGKNKIDEPFLFYGL
jgi:hypothetical protein